MGCRRGRRGCRGAAASGLPLVKSTSNERASLPGPRCRLRVRRLFDALAGNPTAAHLPSANRAKPAPAASGGPGRLSATIERPVLVCLMLVDMAWLLLDRRERDADEGVRTFLVSRRSVSLAGKPSVQAARRFDRGPRTSNRRERTGDRGGRTIDRDRRSDDRGPKPFDRDRRTDHRGSMLFDRARRPFDRARRTFLRGDLSSHLDRRSFDPDHREGDRYNRFFLLDDPFVHLDHRVFRSDRRGVHLLKREGLLGEKGGLLGERASVSIDRSNARNRRPSISIECSSTSITRPSISMGW
jgi:hypothetical protein